MTKIKIYHKNILTGAGIHDFVSVCDVSPDKVADELAFFAKIGVKCEKIEDRQP